MFNLNFAVNRKYPAFHLNQTETLTAYAAAFALTKGTHNHNLQEKSWKAHTKARPV
jgi:hypothetical protein